MQYRIAILLCCLLLLSGCTSTVQNRLTGSVPVPVAPEPSLPPTNGFPFVEIIDYETKFIDPQPITLSLKNTGTDAWFHVQFYTHSWTGNDPPKLFRTEGPIEAPQGWTKTMSWSLPLSGGHSIMRVEVISCPLFDSKIWTCTQISSAELWH